MHIDTSDQARLKLGFYGHSCNWGVHMCGLYETEAERDEIIFGFLGQGMEDGDLQLFCHTEQSADHFREGFARACPHCREGMGDRDRLQIMPARDLYYPDGTFSPWQMDDGLNAFYAASQQNGPRNVRGTAEMVWALEAIPGVEHLMAYESRLNYFIPGKPWISICLYNLTRFDGSTIMNVLRTHPYTISKGVITENPYFQDPDQWLARNAPQFLGRD